MLICILCLLFEAVSQQHQRVTVEKLLASERINVYEDWVDSRPNISFDTYVFGAKAGTVDIETSFGKKLFLLTVGKVKTARVDMLTSPKNIRCLFELRDLEKIEIYGVLYADSPTEIKSFVSAEKSLKQIIKDAVRNGSPVEAQFTARYKIRYGPVN